MEEDKGRKSYDTLASVAPELSQLCPNADIWTHLKIVSSISKILASIIAKSSSFFIFYCLGIILRKESMKHETHIRVSTLSLSTAFCYLFPSLFPSSDSEERSSDNTKSKIPTTFYLFTFDKSQIIRKNQSFRNLTNCLIIWVPHEVMSHSFDCKNRHWQ